MINMMLTWSEIARCYPIFVQDYPLLSFDDYTLLMDRRYAAGYRIAAVIIADDVYGLAGVRVSKDGTLGKILIVDDFIADQRYRSYGVGHSLLLWLAQYAQEQQCCDVRLVNHSLRTGSRNGVVRATCESLSVYK